MAWNIGDTNSSPTGKEKIGQQKGLSISWLFGIGVCLTMPGRVFDIFVLYHPPFSVRANENRLLPQNLVHRCGLGVRLSIVPRSKCRYKWDSISTSMTATNTMITATVAESQIEFTFDPDSDLFGTIRLIARRSGPAMGWGNGCTGRRHLRKRGRLGNPSCTFGGWRLPPARKSRLGRGFDR